MRYTGLIMRNFDYCARTNMIFGKDTEARVGDEAARYAKRVLLHHSIGG